MYRTFARALLALATASTMVLGGTVAQAAPRPEPTAPTVEPQVRVPFPYSQPRLVRVRYAPHRAFDRLVFDFRGGVPDDFEARYVRRVLEDPSGRRVRLPGRAFLVLRVEPARARAFVRGLQRVRGLDDVLAYRLVGDFEGVVRVAVALRQRVDFRLFELPNRLVLDLYHDDRFARDSDDDDDDAVVDRDRPFERLR